MKINYEYLYQSLGDSDDVKALTDFLYANLKNKENKTFFKSELPDLSFKIDELCVDFFDSDDLFLSAFGGGFSKLTNNGYMLKIYFNYCSLTYDKIFKNVHNILRNHKKTTKKIQFGVKTSQQDKENKQTEYKLDTLLDYLYMSDDGEINAKVSSNFIKSINIIKENNIYDDEDKINTLKKIIDGEETHKKFIHFNINNHLAGVSEDSIILFLNEYFKIKDIQNTQNNIILKFIYFLQFFEKNKQRENKYLNYYLKNIEKFVNTQGYKLKKQLYDMYYLL